MARLAAVAAPAGALSGRAAAADEPEDAETGTKAKALLGMRLGRHDRLDDERGGADFFWLRASSTPACTRRNAPMRARHVFGGSRCGDAARRSGHGWRRGCLVHARLQLLPDQARGHRAVMIGDLDAIIGGTSSRRHTHIVRAAEPSAGRSISANNSLGLTPSLRMISA
jgi:hypothetical protein